jgi:hypothetical protein
MRPVIVIPFGSECPHRQRALAHTRQHWHDAGLRVVIGRSEPFTKGAAAADGVERCGADLLVIADGDCLVTHLDLRRSVEALLTGAAWTQPHRMVVRLTPRTTGHAYAGHLGAPGARPVAAPAGGGIVVLTRAAWEASGGIDPRFDGWGGDDISFARALDTLVGPGARLNGVLWHLWHPKSPRRPGNRGSPENEAVAARYLEANGDPEAMRAVLASRGSLIG